jgi:hypothetical protein
MLAACLLAQDRGGTPLGEARMQIGDVFSRAHASGSLEYWGVCNFERSYPDFPKLRAVPDHEKGSAVELLREMFSVDPEMRVSQDADGKIRMIEKDVPSDLLDVKIHHLQFPIEFRGPNMAIIAILKTPEVIAFRREHNIRPEADWGPGISFPSEAFAAGEPSVHGDLVDVTVREALDYVLLRFHGLWFYENCENHGGGRRVYFGFIENVPGALAMPHEITGCDTIFHSNLTPISPFVASTYSNSLNSSLPHADSPFGSHISTFNVCPSNDTWQFVAPKHLAMP